MNIVGQVDLESVTMFEKDNTLIYSYINEPNISITLSTELEDGHYRILAINNPILNGYTTALLYFLTNDLKYRLVVDASFGIGWIRKMFRTFRCTFGFFVRDNIGRDIEDINIYAVVGDLFIFREEWFEEHPFMFNGEPEILPKKYFGGWDLLD